MGSRNQQLIEISKEESDGLFSTLFFLLKKDGKKYFSKKTEKNKIISEEYQILKKIKHKNIIRSIELNEEFGLVMEYFEGKKLPEIGITKVINKIEWLKEFDLLVNYLKERRVYSKIDIHESNLLFKIYKNKILDWRLIDFEIFNQGDTTRNDAFIKRLKMMIHGRL